MSDIEQDEPGIINVAGPSTKVDSPTPKKENVGFFSQYAFCLFTNNLNPSERVSFAEKSSSFKAVQRNTKSRIKACRHPTDCPNGN